ncbi:hypothetical protein PIB30_065519 [Stylosanthes scabra]|uniref:Uncharacterized protein n=1 Tax=Stylosanthes scabra TaxID=79078 RepID=A0ABU6XNB9_9FABA|nr:hypothetical protein [Stylosanthes scabra]
MVSQTLKWKTLQYLGCGRSNWRVVVKYKPRGRIESQEVVVQEKAYVNVNEIPHYKNNASLRRFQIPFSGGLNSCKTFGGGWENRRLYGCRTAAIWVVSVTNGGGS